MAVQLENSSSLWPTANEPDRRAHAELRDAGYMVYRQILDAILEQRLPPGTKLGEEQLAEIFSVSRPVVRRALAQLSFERVVEIKPNRGAFIANPTVEDAHRIFEARCVIEEATVRGCARHHSKKDIAKLQRHVESELECERKGDRVRWIRLTGEFHLAVAHAAGNELLSGFLKDLVAQTSLIIALYGNGAKSLCSDTDHANIVKAIAEHDEPSAVAKMLGHLHVCEDALVMDVTKDTADLSEIFRMRRGGAGAQNMKRHGARNAG